MFWRHVCSKKMEKETNMKNNLKILVILIVWKGLKEINVGNDKKDGSVQRRKCRKRREKRQKQEKENTMKD